MFQTNTCSKGRAIVQDFSISSIPQERNKEGTVSPQAEMGRESSSTTPSLTNSSLRVNHKFDEENLQIKTEVEDLADSAENLGNSDSRNTDSFASDASGRSETVGWVMVDAIPVPYLVRSKQKYVSVRVVEETILRRYPSDYPQELREHRMDSVYCTSAEATLLNDICAAGDSNAQLFSNKDVIVKLNDFVKFFNSLKHYYPDVSLSVQKNSQPLHEPNKKFSPLPPVETKEEIRTDSSPSSSTQSPEQEGSPSPTWIQMNNALVPSIRFSHDIYVPLEVIRNAAKLLSDTREFPVSKLRPLGDCTDMLNELCKKSSILFTFDANEQLISLEYILNIVNPQPFWTELPKDNPIGNAVTIPQQRAKRGKSRDKTENGLRTLLQLPKKTMVPVQTLQALQNPPQSNSNTQSLSSVSSSQPIVASPPYFPAPIMVNQVRDNKPPLPPRVVPNYVPYPPGYIAPQPSGPPRLPNELTRPAYENSSQPPPLQPPPHQVSPLQAPSHQRPLHQGAPSHQGQTPLPHVYPPQHPYLVQQHASMPYPPPVSIRPPLEHRPGMIVVPQRHTPADPRLAYPLHQAPPPPNHNGSVHPGAPQEPSVLDRNQTRLYQKDNSQNRVSVKLAPSAERRPSLNIIHIPDVEEETSSQVKSACLEAAANSTSPDLGYKTLSANKVVVLEFVGTRQIPCLVFCSADGKSVVRRISVFHLQTFFSEDTQYDVIIQMLHIENIPLCSAAHDSRLLLGLPEDRDQLLSLTDCKAFCDKLGYGTKEPSTVMSSTTTSVSSVASDKNVASGPSNSKRARREQSLDVDLSDDQTIPIIIGVGSDKESKTVSLYHTCNILFPVNLRSHVRRAVNKLFKKDEERFKVSKDIAKMLELPDGETILLNLPALRAKFPQLKALVTEFQIRDEECAILD